jgi:stalled ribosome rescue protein Dom34
MQISEHYSDYPEKTLIVVTNNEMAKILSAHEREVAEIAKVKNTSEEKQDFYPKLSKRLRKLLKEEYKRIVLCAPEARKEAVVEHMHKDVMEKVSSVVPKNLASLEPDQIIRILQETRSE